MHTDSIEAAFGYVAMCAGSLLINSRLGAIFYIKNKDDVLMANPGTRESAFGIGLNSSKRS